VPEVFGEVDGGHAARAELALDAVAVPEDRIQALDSIIHGTIRSGLTTLRGTPRAM